MLRHRFPRTRWLLAVLFGLFVILSFAPMLSVFVLSFQGPDGGLTFPLRGLSFHWFDSLFNQRQLAGDFWAAMRRSLGLALTVGSATVVVAFLAGLAFRRRFRGSGVLLVVNVVALVVPSILVSLGIGVMFSQLDLGRGLYTSGLGAHLTWTVPIAVLVMFSVFARFDRRLEEAARDAGASHWMTIRTVIIPIVAPALAGVFVLAVTLSYDEFSRSLLVMGTRNTLPLELFAMTTNVTTPAIYALGTTTTLLSLALIGIAAGVIALLRRGRTQ